MMYLWSFILLKHNTREIMEIRSVFFYEEWRSIRVNVNGVTSNTGNVTARGWVWFWVTRKIFSDSIQLPDWLAYFMFWFVLSKRLLNLYCEIVCRLHHINECQVFQDLNSIQWPFYYIPLILTYYFLPTIRLSICQEKTDTTTYARSKAKDEHAHSPILPRWESVTWVHI